MIDIAQNPSSIAAKIEYAALATLGVSVMFVIALCAQLIIDSVEDAREQEE